MSKSNAVEAKDKSAHKQCLWRIIIVIGLVCSVISIALTLQNTFASYPTLQNNNIHEYAAANMQSYNVQSNCNAQGDGITDDTTAIQTCASLVASTGGVLYFPPGIYIVSSSITFPDFTNNVEITGDGLTSTINWAMDDNLFYFGGTSTVSQLIIEEIKIQSTTQSKSDTNAAFYFPNGLVQSSISDIAIYSGTHTWGSGVICKTVCDTNNFENNMFWGLTGTGYEIGYGSEQRVEGGRIIGQQIRTDNSIGIYCTGYNGGVHIIEVDIIGVHIGLLLDSSNGHGSNREIFITHATFDSSWRGIAVKDASYISIIGLWAASSDQEQIWVDAGISNGPMLVINGGSIFNGGVSGSADCSTACNGITINSGTFILNGVTVRNNQGKGIWIPNGAVNNYVISNCKIFANGVAYSLNGASNYVFQNNVFS